MKPCIGRLLEHWEPLVRYFRDHPDVGKVKAIRKVLLDPCTKPLLCFFEDILTPVNSYNKLFQVSFLMEQLISFHVTSLILPHTILISILLY